VPKGAAAFRLRQRRGGGGAGGTELSLGGSIGIVVVVVGA
jgi:hypothetical protein